MGEVWRAKDTRLARDVAVKVLPEEFFEGGERRQRFEREAKLLASLNHPNIAAVYSFEEIPGSSPLLVMELVEGEPLSKRMKSGAIPTGEALSIGRDIAAALEAAHAKGIVHRDLKPGNVMISTDRRVKLLDFGLAKSFGESVATEDLSESPTLSAAGTEAGVILGTAAYMSPEQARGQRVDTRADIWAFGVVLYEMLAGARLFRGESTTDTLAAVLREQVDFSRLPASTPREVRDLLERCLERDFQKRRADIGEARRVLEKGEAGGGFTRAVGLRLAAVMGALILVAAGGVWMSRRIAPGARTGRQSVAVLPFVNLSGDKEQEFFSDGLSDELIGHLTKVKDLRVTGRISSFAFKGKNDDLAAIGDKLHVKTVLEGSVRRSGDQLRVSTRLLRVADGEQIWGETYERKITDVFAVQDEIAAAVVAALKVKLLPQDRGATALHRSANAEAYNLFLVGRQFYNRHSKDDYVRARDAFRRAVALDPGFAAAYAGLGPAEALAAEFASASSEERDAGRRRSLEIADRAVALDPGLAEAYSARGFVRFDVGWIWTGAREDLERSLTLDPADTNALRWYGQLLASLGRIEDAITSMKKAADADPLNGQALYRLGTYYNAAGLYAEARASFGKALEVNPESAWVPFHLGMTSLLEGKPRASLKEVEKAQEDWRLTGYALANHDLGNEAESRRNLDTLLAKFAERSAYHIAEVHAWRGERDKAFEWLEKALLQRNRYLTWAKFDPTLRSLRDDPRYAALLTKMNLPVAN
jgi:serine/threonine-protein kinase